MSAPRFYYWESLPGLQNTIRQASAEGCPMPDCYFKGRPVYLGKISYGSEPDEAMLEGAVYADDDSEVDSDDLYELEQELGSRLYDGWFEHQVCRAEAWAERDR